MTIDRKNLLIIPLVFLMGLAVPVLVAVNDRFDRGDFEPKDDILITSDDGEVVWFNLDSPFVSYAADSNTVSVRASEALTESYMGRWPVDSGEPNSVLTTTGDIDAQWRWSPFDANSIVWDGNDFGLPEKTPWNVMFVDATGYPLSEDPNNFTYYQPETAFGVGLDNIAEGTYANNYIQVYSLLDFDPNLFNVTIGRGSDDTATGPNNVTIGRRAGDAVTTGAQNSFGGSNSGESVVFRDDNAFWGFESGKNVGGGGYSGAGSYKYTYISENGKIYGIPVTDQVVLYLDNGGLAVNIGGGIVALPYTNNPFVSGETVRITGTTNYNGLKTLTAGTDTTQLRFAASYVAEVFDGIETVVKEISVTSGPGQMVQASDGTLYYAHNGVGTNPNVYYVTRIDPDGTTHPDYEWLDKVWNTPTSSRWVAGIAITPDDQYLYLWIYVDGITPYGYMFKFDLTTGATVWEAAGVAWPSFSMMALDDSGNAYAEAGVGVNKFASANGARTTLNPGAQGDYGIYVDDDLSVVINTGNSTTFGAVTLDGLTSDTLTLDGVLGASCLTIYNGFIYATTVMTLYKISWDGSNLAVVSSVALADDGQGIYVDLWGNIVVIHQEEYGGDSNVLWFYDTDLNPLSQATGFNTGLLASWNQFAAEYWNKGSIAFYPGITGITDIGNANTAIGSQALAGSLFGAEPNETTAGGYKNMFTVESGDLSTSWGAYGLGQITTGSRDLGLGPYAGWPITTQNDYIVFDARKRTSIANMESQSIIVGQTAADPNEQWLNINVGELNLPLARLDVNDVNVAGVLSLQGQTASRLLATDASKNVVSTDLVSWVAATANETTVADDGDGTITIGIVDPLIVGKGGTGAATLTDHGILLGSGTDAVTPLGVATNGQIPIGSTGADPVLATITGTANQITSTPGAGSITLSTPQDIHTGASPTFAGLLLVNLINEFSTDTALAGNSDGAVPTEKAVKTYVDSRSGPGTGNVVWREIRTDFTLTKKGATPPGEESETIGASGNLLAYNYAFNPAVVTDEEVFFHIIIPSDIDESRNVQFYLGWWPDTNWVSGDYRWVLEYLIRDVDDMYGPNIDRTAGTPTVIYKEETPANATDLIETPFYDPNTIDANKNQVIFCRLSLDASESLANDDGHVYYAMFQYAVNTPGPTLGVQMLFEDGDTMLFEDGARMLYENET